MKYGIATEEGKLLEKGGFANEIREKGPEALVAELVLTAKKYRAAHNVQGIAVATSGVVDPASGTILYAAKHFPGYAGLKMKERLERETGLPCSVENDVNAAAMGEYWKGAGRGADSLFCITVGTGIGGCAMLHGKVLHGAACCAGEVGRQYIRPGATWEETASTAALVRKVAAVKQVPEASLDGKKIFALAEAGDSDAVKALDRLTVDLAMGIANICYTLNPERLIIGGGIAAREDVLRPGIEKALQTFLIPPVLARLEICFAKLKNDAGMIGALYNFLSGEHADIASK